MGTAAGLLLLVLIIGFLFLARISVYFLGLVIFSRPWKGINSDGAFVAFVVVVIYDLDNMIGISMINIILMILLLLLLVLRILSTAVVGEGAAFYADV